MKILKTKSVAVSLTLAFFTAMGPVYAAEPPVPEAPPPCEPDKAQTPDPTRSEVYKGMPFQPGEELRYVLKYGGLRVHVGYGFLRVEAPVKQLIPVIGKDGQLKQESRWHRIYTAEAYTGDWYKLIFAAHDKLQAVSRPWDFGISKFYISQNEEKPFVRRYHAEKWLNFDHVNCKVQERSVDHKKNKEKNEEHPIQVGAVDAMGAAYKLRTFDYKMNKTERFLVYTSEKNWWMEATPVAEESLKTKIGTFKGHKLAIKSYLGKDLQQRGKLFVWIASDHPQRPILKIEGEVTFGSVYMEIDQLKAGVALDAPPVAAPTPAAEPAKAEAAPAPEPAKAEAPKAGASPASGKK